MKPGDKIRIVKIPENLPADEMHTRELFQQCVGREFPIVGIDRGLLQLDVGSVRGKPNYAESIYIEPKYVRQVKEK